MTRVRRVLGRVAVAWLFCQAATLVAAPIGFWVGSAEELLECTCAHGDHAICPMHHKPAPGPKVCLMQSADTGPAVLSSLFGAVGVVPGPVEVFVPPSEHIISQIEVHATSLGPAPPDPPPPRA
jgi:hypothetical protein